MYKQWLKGTWFLDTFTATGEDGETIHVMGEGATGFICYSHDGWVSVQMSQANRPRYEIPTAQGGTDEQTLAAARGLFTYAGKYTVDEENAIVYHNLDFSLITNWIGSSQKRYITKENENVLILSADPTKIGPGGKMRKVQLRWIRMES